MGLLPTRPVVLPTVRSALSGPVVAVCAGKGSRAMDRRLGVAGRGAGLEGTHVTAVRTALPVARIPVLLMLLWATALPIEDMNRATARLDVSSYWGPWALVSLVSMAFVVVMLVGRRRWHPWPVLVVEAGVAATVAFVPRCTG